MRMVPPLSVVVVLLPRGAAPAELLTASTPALTFQAVAEPFVTVRAMVPAPSLFRVPLAAAPVIVRVLPDVTSMAPAVVAVSTRGVLNELVIRRTGMPPVP